MFRPGLESALSNFRASEVGEGELGGSRQPWTGCCATGACAPSGPAGPSTLLILFDEKKNTIVILLLLLIIIIIITTIVIITITITIVIIIIATLARLSIAKSSLLFP